MATRIGSLIIDLALEYGLLKSGLSASEKEVAKTVKAIQRRGKEIADFGSKLATAITAPLLGLAGGAVAAVNAMAGEVKAMGVAAATAGAGFEEFQRTANAALISAGIESDKLGDILKDTKDKIGDFAATGGGELKDFFEKIAAPQGLTVNDFLGKSSIEQLRMFVGALEKAGVSSEEMVFYLESIADEGSLLLPILKNNGKELDALGKKTKVIDKAAVAELKRYTDAQTQLSGAFRELTIAAVNSGLASALVDLAKGAADILRQFAELSPTGFKVAVTVAALAAALGPVLIGLGAMISTGASTITMLVGLKTAFDFAGIIKNLIPMIGLLGKAMLGLLANPVLLAAAVVIGGIFVAWQNWDKIKPIIDRVADAVVGFWSDHVAPVLSKLGSALVDAAIWWFNLHADAVKWIAALVMGVKDWLQGKLGAIFDWVGKKIAAVTGFFFDMYDAVVGNSYVPDMVDGIDAEFKRLEAVMVDPAKKATTSVTDATRKMAEDVTGILDRLFPEFARARKLQEELALIDGAGLNEELRRRARLRLLGEGQSGATVSAGLLNEGPLVDFGQQLGELQDQLSGVAQKAKTQTVQIAESFRDMADKSIQALDRMVGAIRGGGFLDILGSAVNLFLQLGSTGLFGKTLATTINAPRIPGNANGTAFHPGGLMKVGERGPEILQVPRGGRVIPNHELREAGAMAGRLHVTVGIDPRNGNITAFVNGQIAATAPAVANLGAMQAQGMAARSARRRVR